VLEAQIADGADDGYAHWMKIFNLKKAALSVVPTGGLREVSPNKPTSQGKSHADLSS